MAKDVKFNIRLTIDGKEQIVTASTNVKGLARELGIAADRGSQFRDALLRINQSTQAFQNMFAGVQQLTGVMQQYTQANAVQQEAEVKLATVMRQRMQATEGDIKAIKDLCSAQQELGIIGDEVQLMGAQQIATFIENRQTLETLVPAMNNLLAQQRGFNATGSDAVSVANLMGKAMQGQVSALTRVGITFNATQEQVLKYGTESERAAMLAEVITQNVGNMNAELRNTDAGQAKALANSFGDLKEKIGAMVAPFESTLMYVGQLSLAANAIGTMVGGIVGAVRAARTLALSMSFAKIQTAAAALGAKIYNGVLVTYRAVATWATAATTTFGVALRGLLIASGVGAVIVALGYAINALMSSTDDASDSLDELSEAEQRSKNAAEAERAEVERNTAELNRHIAICKNFKGTKEEEKKIVQELNNTYGSTMGYFSSVSAWYKTLTANSETYTRQMIAEARARRLANQIAEIDQQIHNINYDDEGNRRKYSTQNESRVDYVYAGMTQTGQAITRAVNIEAPNSSPWDKAAQQTTSLVKQRNALFSQLNEVTSQSFTMPVTGPAAPTGSTIGGHTGGHNTGNTNTGPVLTENAITYKQLADNVAYYQAKLEEANITDLAAFGALVKKKQAADEALEAYQQMLEVLRGMEGYDVEAETVEGMNRNIDALRKQLTRTEPDSEPWQAITDEIQMWQNRLDGVSDTSVTAIEQQIARIDSQLKNADLDVEAAVELTTTKNQLQKQLDDIAREVTFKTEIEGREGSLAELDRAIQFYSDRQQTEDADNVRETQDIIDRLTKKKSVFELSIELAEKSNEVREIEALTSKERTLRIRGIGFDELSSRIKDIDNRLADTNITDKQRKELQELSRTYKEWRKQSVNAFDTVKEGWDGVKGIGNGFKSMTDALQGNGDAWNKITSIIDGFISIYESVKSVIGIIKTMTLVSHAHAAAKVAESGAVMEEAATEVAAQSTKAPILASEVVAAKAGAAAFMELAAAGYMAAHASIPFAGFGIAAGFTAAAKALVLSMGATAFADGGIAFGPTVGLFGEYPGARSNPEVVAPLDRLSSLMNSDGMGGKVKFKIKGRVLEGVLEREKRHLSRM